MRTANKDELILVAGAGGFVGGHLVRSLLGQGFNRVRGVDIKPLEEWLQTFPQADNRRLDLSGMGACLEACEGVAYVFNLASDMGGIGFIENNKALCMLSVLINTQMLQASRRHGVKRFLFSSSACVYSAEKQVSPHVTGLKEEDAYPAMPEDGYGWEKLFSECMTTMCTDPIAPGAMVAKRCPPPFAER